MAFSHHEACPRCRENGLDLKGDNLARYTNGSAWCFSCKYIEKPTKYVPSEPKKTSAPPTDLTLNFAKENLDWLKQYLYAEEIGEFFRYSPSLGRHVFQHEGFWEARSVNKEPKTLSHGNKPFIIFGSGSPVVFVEDVVSAIKVARVASAIPLFGSHIPPEWLVRVAKLRPEHVIVWLDNDKHMEAREYAWKYNKLQPGICMAISTYKDPKAYTTDEIRSYLMLDEPPHIMPKEVECSKTS